MRFEDIVICVGSIAVIGALIAFPLDMVFVLALGLTQGYDIALIVSLFLAPLITGYIFAGKLWEARRETIAKIAVLSAVLMMLVAMNIPTLASWGPKIKEEYQAAYPGTTLSTYESYVWELMTFDLFAFVIVAMVLVFDLIGLYVGSMFRRPVKSGK